MQTLPAWNHYHSYSELTELLEALSKEYPKLLKYSSIGESKKGRKIWAVELTNLATGDFSEKPAFYLDGNHHAGEVTGSIAALHFIWKLATGYGKDEKITALLDRATVYVIPRVSPDGAEAYLTTPEHLRSVDRPYPYEQPEPGLQPKDMDGDGCMRMMRVPSPYGSWKVCETDPRLMVKRQPDDFGGQYYHVFDEGEFIGYNGLDLTIAANKWGLDFNRNYPYGWFPEARQPGAGAYPLSNPENKALVEFVLAHKNIVCGATNHTTGGIIIYPPGTKPEKQGDPFDMKLYREIGAMGTAETGYACTNIFDEFLRDQENYSSGAFDDWLYQTQGILAYTVELWDMMLRAGAKSVFPTKDKPVISAEELQSNYQLGLDWIEKNVPGAYKPWAPFEHPQLGPVEIGGIDFKFTVQNCPPAFLKQEVEKASAFCLRYAAALPCLKVLSFTAAQGSEGVYTLDAVVANVGYLPTYGSKETCKLQLDEAVCAELSCPGAVILGGQQQKLGQLEGYSGIKSEYSHRNIMTKNSAPCAKKAQWVIAGKPGDVVTLTVSGPRCGKATASVTL